MNPRMPSGQTMKSFAGWGVLVSGSALALMMFRTPASQVPEPVAPAQVSLPPVLTTVSKMVVATNIAQNTATVNEGQALMKPAITPRVAMNGQVEEWFKDMLANTLPKVPGCNEAARTRGFVEALAPTNQQQAALKAELKTVVANNLLTDFTTSREAITALQDVLKNLDADPCGNAMTVQSEPMPQVATQPKPTLAAARAGAMVIPAQPEQAAPLQVEQPVQQPVRTKRKEKPTHCLGFATLGCDVSEAPQPEITTGWAAAEVTAEPTR